MSVGYDHIRTAAAEKRKIPIANTPGVLTEAVAVATVLLLLAASRRAYEAQAFLRSGGWEKASHASLVGWQVKGKLLEIYGARGIWQAVVDRARVLGMKIHYSDRSSFWGT